MAWRGAIRFPSFATSTYGKTWKPIIKCYKYPTYHQRAGRKENAISSWYEADETILSRPFNMFQNKECPFTEESTSLVFWAECATVNLSKESLNIHFERLASSITLQNGTEIPMQNLNISQELADSIQSQGIVPVTLVGIVAEKQSSDNKPVEHIDAKQRTTGKGHIFDPFELWERAVYCLIVSAFEGNHARCEGVLVLKLTDWYGLARQLRFCVLD